MNRLLTGIFVVAALGIPGPASSGAVEVGFQYDLADFSGTIPYSDARVAVDVLRDEAYSVFANEVRVFNASGMETYGFTYDPNAGRLLDLAVMDDGSFLFLLYGTLTAEGTSEWSVRTADFRGRPGEDLAVDRSGLPAGFRPDRILHRSGTIWLAATASMHAVALSPAAEIERTIDLGEVAGIPEADRPDVQIAGFDVDAAGNILFSVPVKFRVYIVAPDGQARSFGRVGSAAGNFGNVSGVVTDGHGNIWVSDRLRGVVMGFDSEFRFLREFGQTGNARERLARPGALAVSPQGKLYVSQLRNRGVAVYAIRALD